MAGPLRLQFSPADGPYYRYERYREQKDEPEFRGLIGAPQQSLSLNLAPVTLDEIYPLTPYSLIRLKSPLSIGPQSVVDLNLPVSVGYALLAADGYVIDKFDIQPHKYILYGQPSNGWLCHYHPTEAVGSDHQISMGEMVIEVSLKNSRKSWVQVRNVVIYAPQLRLYSNESGQVKSDKVTAQIHGRDSAIVNVVAKQPKDMKKAWNTYTSRSMPSVGDVVKGRELHMEWGL